VKAANLVRVAKAHVPGLRYPTMMVRNPDKADGMEEAKAQSLAKVGGMGKDRGLATTILVLETTTADGMVKDRGLATTTLVLETTTAGGKMVGGAVRAQGRAKEILAIHLVQAMGGMATVATTVVLPQA